MSECGKIKILPKFSEDLIYNAIVIAYLQCQPCIIKIASSHTSVKDCIVDLLQYCTNHCRSINKAHVTL